MEPYLKSKRSSLDQTRASCSWTDPSPQPAISYTVGSDSWNDSVSGFKNPNHRQQIRAHQGATTPLSGERRFVRGSLKAFARLDFISNPPNPTQIHRRNYGRAYLSSAFAGTTSLPIDAAYNDAVIAYLKDARAQMTAVYAGTVLGELKEALSMIIHPAKSLRRRIDEYLRSAQRRAGRIYRQSGKRGANRFLANSWLEYSFGLRPTMADAANAAVAFNESINRYKGNYARCRGYASVEREISVGDPVVIQEPTDRIRYQFSRIGLGRVESRLIGLVGLEFDNPLAFRLDLFGFDLNSFIPTVYELIPYSWMVDYFSNVGGVLQAWTFPIDRIKWTNTTNRRSRILRVSGELVPPRSFISYPAKIVSTYGDPLFFESTIREVERSAGTPIMPSFGFKVPGLGTKWINLFALGRSRRLSVLNVR